MKPLLVPVTPGILQSDSRTTTNLSAAADDDDDMQRPMHVLYVCECVQRSS